MLRPIISSAELSSNTSLASQQQQHVVTLDMMLCPHCGTRNSVIVDEFQDTKQRSEAYHCRRCVVDMHASVGTPPSRHINDVTNIATLTRNHNLTQSEADVLQAIIENQPIKLEPLAKRSGVAEMTVSRSLHTLRVIGVYSTKTGYVFEYNTKLLTDPLEDLTDAQMDTLQAIVENEPIKLELLITKSGVARSTANDALKKLRIRGVRSTKRGYVATDELRAVFTTA